MTTLEAPTAARYSVLLLPSQRVLAYDRDRWDADRIAREYITDHQSVTVHVTEDAGHFHPLVEYVCRRGHSTLQRDDVTAVSCGTCSRDLRYHGTVEMRRRDLFPSWCKAVAS